jgi:hypothetical protein
VMGTPSFSLPMTQFDKTLVWVWILSITMGVLGIAIGFLVCVRLRAVR